MLKAKQICIPFLDLLIRAGPRIRIAETESRAPVVEVVLWGRAGLMFSRADAEGRAAASADPQPQNGRGGR